MSLTKNIYACYDSVDDDYKYFGYFDSHRSYIRANVIHILSSGGILRDLTVCKVGEIDFKTGKVKNCPNVKYSWADYKMPENRADALSPLGFSPEELEQAYHKANEELEKEISDEVRRKNEVLSEQPVKVDTLEY